MPELPEVETCRRKIEKAIKGKTVADVTVHPDKLIFRGKSPAAVKKVFLHAKIKKCLRRGKYIWFEMDSGPWPVFHLGMTGSYLIMKDLPDSSIKAVKLILEMEDGTVFVFRDPRRFGRIFLLDDPLSKKPLSDLGPDVLNELPSVAELRELFMKRKAPIKAVLMDQSMISGIGNWVADEVLFQSQISPHRLALDLSAGEIKKLHAKISSVTKLSVKAGADHDKYPKNWLFHHRWGKKAGSVSTGAKLKHDVVGGRSTAWVPSVQK